MFKGFRQFILRGNVVDLAVAVVVGTLFAAMVKAFVADILTPLIAAIAGQPDFADLKFTVHHSAFLYGDLLNNVITFVAVAATVYFLVVLPLNSLAQRRAKVDPPADEVSPDVAVLMEIRDLLAGGSTGGAQSSSE